MSKTQNSADQGQNPRPRRLVFYERGPGPAAYTLPPLLGRPNHDVTHYINPSVPIGVKLPKSFVPPGPGPGKYGIDQGRKANGLYNGLAYTIRPKLPDPGKTQTPGPAAYLPCGVEFLRTKAPTFTMRIRPQCLKRSATPAPNAYLLPSMIGPNVLTRPARAPCSMKGDRLSKSLYRSPGPVYDIGRPELVKPQAPGYTMRIKWADLQGQRWAAGPGSYELNKEIYPKRPAWKFGIKHTDFAGILKNKCSRLTSVQRPCGS